MNRILAASLMLFSAACGGFAFALAADPRYLALAGLMFGAMAVFAALAGIANAR